MASGRSMRSIFFYVACITLLLSIGSATSQRTTARCPDGCDCEAGQIVNCIGKNLKFVPEEIPEDTVYLNLRNNDMETLNLNIIKALLNLKGLDVSSNKISTILGSFEQFPKITDIELYNNKLMTLSSSTFGKSITWIHYVSLYDNPWNCDCNLRWMKTLMDSSEPKLSPRMVKCETPEELRGNYTAAIDEDMLVCKKIQGLSQQDILLISGLGLAVLIIIAGIVIFLGCRKPPVLGLVGNPAHQRHNGPPPLLNDGMAAAPDATGGGTAPKSVLGQFRQRLPDEEDSRLLYQSS